MKHGHYFESLGLFPTFFYSGTSSSTATAVSEFTGGDFSFDINRRKVRVTPRTSMSLSAVVRMTDICVHGQNIAQTRFIIFALRFKKRSTFDQISLGVSLFGRWVSKQKFKKGVSMRLH